MELKVCPVCRGMFPPKRASQKLCSVACRKIYQHGENASQYKSGRSLSPEGYVRVPGGYEHRVIAEKALGRPLPKGAVVHHIDGDRTNNSPSNLVICPSKSYHQMLHQNQRITDAGGTVGEHLFCGACGELLPVECFRHNRRRVERLCRSSWCRMCSQIKDRQRYQCRRQGENK